MRRGAGVLIYFGSVQVRRRLGRVRRRHFIGVVMIGLALLGVVAQLAGVAAVVGAVAGLSVLGVVATRGTPEPENMVEKG
jgi:hypothetical protein